MRVIMYISAQQIVPDSLTLYKCIKCSRPLFKATSDAVVISNAEGAPWNELPPDKHYIEHQCHSCKTVYKILFL